MTIHYIPPQQNMIIESAKPEAVSVCKRHFIECLLAKGQLAMTPGNYVTYSGTASANATLPRMPLISLNVLPPTTILENIEGIKDIISETNQNEKT